MAIKRAAEGVTKGRPMHDLETYVDPRFVYDFWQGPREVRNLDQALENGINCISLAHLAIRGLFKYELPEELHCAELFNDVSYFDEVPTVSDMEPGDLIWFGLEEPVMSAEEFVPVYQGDKLTNWRDFPVKHVGIFTGKYEDSEPLILHSSNIEGTNVIWPLSRFDEYRRYQKIYGIRRLKDELKDSSAVPA